MDKIELILSAVILSTVGFMCIEVVLASFAFAYEELKNKDYFSFAFYVIGGIGLLSCLLMVAIQIFNN